MIHLPSGSHTIEPAHAHPAMRILDFNGRLKSASATPSGVELVYESDSRALVRLSGTPTHVWIDGVENQPHIPDGVVMLPRGQHLATIWR